MKLCSIALLSLSVAVAGLTSCASTHMDCSSCCATPGGTKKPDCCVKAGGECKDCAAKKAAAKKL